MPLYFYEHQETTRVTGSPGAVVHSTGKPLVSRPLASDGWSRRIAQRLREPELRSTSFVQTSRRAKQPSSDASTAASPKPLRWTRSVLFRSFGCFRRRSALSQPAVEDVRILYTAQTIFDAAFVGSAWRKTTVGPSLASCRGRDAARRPSPNRLCSRRNAPSVEKVVFLLQLLSEFGW